MHLRTVLFAFSLALGIIISQKYIYASEVVVFALILFTLQLTALFFAKKKKENVELILFTLIISFALSFGVIRGQLIEEVKIFTCVDKCQFLGVVVSTPESKDNLQEVTVKVLNDECVDCANVLIKAPLYPEFSVGEKLFVNGKVSLPSNVLPIEINKKGFDYRSYLLNRGIGSTSFYPEIKSEGVVNIAFNTKLILLKDSFVEKINSYVSNPASSLASGMLFGKASFSKELNETFRVAGISHIVVLSGFNIAILISFVLAVLFFLPLVARVIASAIFVVLFVLAVGAEASVVRATIMAFVSLLAMLSGREYVARQALILSFVLIILYDPLALLNSVSFHLSFLATAGIVYLGESISELLEKIKVGGFLNQIFTPTLSAIIATQGYILYTFGFLSLYTFIVNILVVPFVPIAMLLSFFVVVFAYLSSAVAFIFGFMDSALLNVMIGVAKFFSNLPMAKLTASFSEIYLFMYYFLVFVVFFFYSQQEKFFIKKEIKNNELDEEVYKF
jgi:competence protein ComEC